MNRRDFIQDTLALIGLAYAATSCNKKSKIKGSILGASAKVGHLLRDASFPEPTEVITKEVVIVGGGVSGLSAARFLQRNRIHDFVLLDLEAKTGGNATSGSNAVSSYPLGAHYVPLPNNTLTEYQDFLTEAGVIIGRNIEGLLNYNDYHLCFDLQNLTKRAVMI